MGGCLPISETRVSPGCFHLSCLSLGSLIVALIPTRARYYASAFPSPMGSLPLPHFPSSLWTCQTYLWVRCPGPNGCLASSCWAQPIQNIAQWALIVTCSVLTVLRGFQSPGTLPLTELNFYPWSPSRAQTLWGTLSLVSASVAY